MNNKKLGIIYRLYYYCKSGYNFILIKIENVSQIGNARKVLKSYFCDHV